MRLSTEATMVKMRPVRPLVPDRRGRLDALQQIVRGHLKIIAEQENLIQVGDALRTLPFAHRLAGHAHPVSQLLLRDPLLFSQLLDAVG